MEDRSLVRIQLKTGRHHQIRVQLAHAGHPIIGDKKYGRNTPGYLPLGLCSYHIGFTILLQRKRWSMRSLLRVLHFSRYHMNDYTLNR